MGKWKLYIGDKTTPCPKCGKVGVIVTGDHRQTNSASVAVDGSIIHCDCPEGSNFLIAPGTVQINDPLGVSVPTVNKAAAAAAALSALPVFAKSCLREDGCTDAGTDQESVDNFGHAGYYRATPQAEQPQEEPVQHAQAAKKHKPAEPTPPPEDKRPWYKRLFSSPDTAKAAATAGMATARAATTTGITAGATTEAGYAALQKIGGNFATTGRWIAPNPATVFLFGMFYSPKLNSGEQDYIDKMRLEQAAQKKEDVPTRVRFRWEADQYGTMRPKGFHVSARGGQDKVPVRMLQKNTTTGNYEFWEDGANKPTIVWTPDDPGYVSPSNTGNQDNVYIPPNVLVYPESEINSPWSTETPAPGERSFRDYILVHPAGTFDPIYIYLRNLPGQVTGKGQKVTGTWLADAGQGNGSPIPSQIADKLRGRTFSNFDNFRAAFWLEVSKDPVLSQQFKRHNLTHIQKGNSPFTREQDAVGGRERYELHHITPISEGGDVYNVDNMGVTTPKRHIEIHSTSKGK
ncbi:S-type pyocin domain-containing protein [Enterobacteriaceae bacterium H11S18]|nr:S-type pyocin domain-containing protein [Dryocola clanedunensis]MCT4711247.1 S-type pyocin domain-containing protein [Dryocola clanedunensis]